MTDITAVERLAVLEQAHEALSDRFDELLPLVKEIHADMVGRKAVLTVGGRCLKYVVWGVVGVASVFGVSQSNVALHWLQSFPGSGPT